MIHPLQILQSLQPVDTPDPIKRAGALEALKNTMGQGLLQQQEIAQNNDAATTRRASMAADAEVANILRTATFDADGNIDSVSEARLTQNASPHAQAVLTNLSTISGRRSNIQRDRDLTQQGKDTLAETISNNRAQRAQAAANAAAEASKPVEVSGGGSLMSRTGQVLGTAPKAETPNNFQHVPVLDPRDRSQTPIMANYDDRKGVYTDQSGNVIPNARPVPTLATMGDTAGLTDAAKQMLAQQLLATGQIPNVGSGAAGVKQRTDIANRAASGQVETPNLAANGANFKADSGSLTAMQKNFDSLTAFEGTARANLQTAIDQGQKVIDAGSPWINKPLRQIDERGMGNADLTAFRAAKQVAVNEIAKVVSGASLGGVISDSQRHEIESLIPADATLPQILSASKILLSDMDNRKKFFGNQIKEIKGRMAAPQGGKKSDPLGIR